MADRGRPKALDPAKRKLVCGLVSMGFSRWHAARHVGVSRTTLFRAARRDPEFEEQLRQAELQQELKSLKWINEHPSWRARSWLLERQNPELYVRRQPDTLTLGDLHGIFNAVVAMLLRNVPKPEDRAFVMNDFERFFEELGGKKKSSPRVRKAIRKLGLDQPAGQPEASDHRQDACATGVHNSAEMGKNEAKKDENQPPNSINAGLQQDLAE